MRARASIAALALLPTALLAQVVEDPLPASI
jgi:hypothetical protein